MDDRFNRPSYTIHKKGLNIFGNSFHVYDSDDTPLFYTELSTKKLNVDIHLCTDEGMDIKMLTIKPRTSRDLGFIFDVVDPKEQQILGVLQRKGFESTFKDKWMLMPTGERYHGFIEEKNLPLALFRRAIGMGPQTYTAKLEGQLLCTYKQNLNPFERKLTVDFSADTGRRFDHRIGIAAGILLSALEGYKES